MAKRLVPSLLILVSVTAMFSAQAATILHVATDGNDAWSGLLQQADAKGADGPLKTLTKAQDRVRELKESGMPEGGIRVELAPGTYALTEPLVLTQEDGGTADSPVCYAASEKGGVYINGAVTVDQFVPVTDPVVLTHVDEAAKGTLLQADLKALGVRDFGSPDDGGIKIYFQNRPMTLSRWPNTGFTTIETVVVEDGHQIHGIKGSQTGLFTYTGDRPSRWVHEKDGWLHGYWFWDWSDQRQKIADIDTAGSRIRVEEPYHSYGYRPGQWYYAYNMLCEIDEPGEWYVDRDLGILYFWPPEPVQPGDVQVSVSDQLMILNNVESLQLHGLVFEGARGLVLDINEGSHVDVLACTFRNSGEAIRIVGDKAHRVFGCHLYQLDGKGIAVTGGDRESLTAAGHVIENNHIHDYGLWNRMYCPAVWMNGVGNRIVHNLIHDAPHSAIIFGGNDHEIHFNEIHHVCLESNDAGAIYCGRNWTMRGTTVKHNYIHHVLGYLDKGCMGVYLDDMYCGTVIEGNVFYKVCRAAFIGGGRDCSILNNIFVDCDPACHVDARALGWAHQHADDWIIEAETKETLSGIRYKEAPYSERYEGLDSILDQEPKAPVGNSIRNNICVGGTWASIEKKAEPYLVTENNMIDKDPHFVDRAGHDFRLKEDSPVYALGFETIPVEKIGLYTHADYAD
ncbi:MAG: right-handed parallel beta-helix repeat-containing protein [Candidatus Hydrogenedentales bacterium]